MIIRVLSELEQPDQWIRFCQRENPYCYIKQPDSLVDFQTSFLTLTQLDGSIRDGRDAIKYSIGSRSSVEPAWLFIKHCNFSLKRMLAGLQQLEFNGNARDNSLRGLIRDVTVRKFFSKEKALISPTTLATLEPVRRRPQRWNLHDICALLANNQFSDLRRHLDTPRLPSAPPLSLAADPEQANFTPLGITQQAHGHTGSSNAGETNAGETNKGLSAASPNLTTPCASISPLQLILELIEAPQRWQLHQHHSRFLLARDERLHCSFIPQLMVSA